LQLAWPIVSSLVSNENGTSHRVAANSAASAAPFEVVASGDVVALVAAAGFDPLVNGSPTGPYDTHRTSNWSNSLE
jgi:hypothetical protein